MIQRINLDTWRPWLTFIAIVGTLGVNLWSNLFPINGLSIGQISNTLFANVQIIPANYAFAIWGLIYIGLIALGVYQLLPEQRQNPILQRTTYLLVIACIAQILWVFLFLNRQFLLSVVAMLGILLPLNMMYLRLGIGQHRASRQERWLVQAPISIYLAWITVATVVNVASALYSIGWNGWGIATPMWTALMVLVSGAIGAVISLRYNDRAYPLVIVWALVAIVIRQLGQPLIAITAAGVAIGLVLLLVIQILQQRLRRA